MEYNAIGRNIRKCRDAKNIKQESLAEMADLSASYMGAIERGEKLPSFEVFIRIANALEVSSDTLLSGVLKVENKIVASELSLLLSELPSKEQLRILHVVKTMIDDLK